MSRIACLITLTLALTLVGCQGTAKVMTYDSVSATGVVWIPENIERHRKVAEGLMKSKCPAGYKVLKEGRRDAKAGDEDGYYLTFKCANAD